MCKMKGGCKASKLIIALVVVGALNWGMIGLAGVNLVEAVLGRWALVVRIVYVLVGIGGLLVITGGCKCKKCKMDAEMGGKDACCGSGKCDSK
jgi:uncharacterized membrane protein YuzA (DUF378 family)